MKAVHQEIKEGHEKVVAAIQEGFGTLASAMLKQPVTVRDTPCYNFWLGDCWSTNPHYRYDWWSFHHYFILYMILCYIILYYSILYDIIL